MADRKEHEDRYQRGMDLLRRRCFEQAARELASLWRRSDLVGRLSRYYSAVAHKEAGLEALNQGRNTAAEQHLRKAMSLAGGSGELVDYLCGLYARTGMAGDCVQTTEQALREDSTDVQRWCQHAQAQWQAGQRTRAYMTLSQGLREVGNHARLHLQTGLFHAAEGRFELARTSLEQAVSLDQADAKGHYYLGLTLAALRQAPAALGALQRACELAPGDLAALHQLALTARLSGVGVVLRPVDGSHCRENISQARQLARYVTREGDFADAFLHLPASDVDAELFGLLEQVLRIALAEHEDYADLHCHLSRVLARLGRTHEAIPHARRALAINPNYRLVQLHLGRLLLEAGQHAAGLEHLRRVLELGGEWPDVHTLVASALAREGNLTEARTHLGRALELKPHYEPAALALARLAA